MEISRRDLCALLPAATLLSALPLESQTMKTLANSEVFPFDKPAPVIERLQARRTDNLERIGCFQLEL